MQQAPRSPPRTGGVAIPPRCDLLKAKTAQVLSRIPGAGFAHGSVYVSSWRPASVFMCVFPYVCVWLRVCGGVSGCVWVSFRIGLSANLLENENKPGSWQLFPEPGSSAASRQTVTAGLMTEHTCFPSGLLNCTVRYSETKEIKDYTDSNKYVTGATRGSRLPGCLGTVPSRQWWWRWEKGLAEPRAWDQAWLGLC